MWWIVGVVAVIVLAATYVTWLASRVDRLHARATAACNALDAHLVRRAAAALELAEASGAAQVRRAARAALDCPPLGSSPDDERSAVENDLTRALRALPVPDWAARPLYAAVVAASRRVALSRQVNDDLVRDALAMRRRRLVRLLRMTRRHPQPRYFDVDDPMLAAMTSESAAG